MRQYLDESQQPGTGCMSMWGLVHVRNMIQQQQHCKYEADDANEAEKLLIEMESPYLSSKRYRVTKKKSLKARIKGLISKEMTRESEEDRRGKKGFSFKPLLQRTYSIHHLESLDDIGTDWKHPIVFVPGGNVESSSATQSLYNTTQAKADSNQDYQDSQSHDVLEIFKVDKEFLLMKHVRDGDERVANFSRMTLGLEAKAIFSKSRSFPVLSDRRKVQSENKWKEIWSFPRRENKYKTVNQTPGLNRLGYFGTRPGKLADDVKSNNEMLSQDTMIRDDKQAGNNNTHSRSSSLNESLDKYAKLFENSFRMDAKLNTSKSLKLTNEYGHAAPVYLRRICSLSNADSFYSNQNFEVLSDRPSRPRHSEEEKVSTLLTSEEEKDGNEDSLKEEADISPNELPDHAFVFDLDTGSLQKTESRAVVEHQIDPTDLKSLDSKSLSPEYDEISTRIVKCLNKTNNSDLHYVKQFLDRSGIALDASLGMTWHSSDQPLGPQLFEKMEACWPHEQDQLDVWPDYRGCWHHQMLFDLVNEVLVEASYDLSFPYYPKALSSSCRVRPFPVGNHIIIEEHVCASVSTLLNLKPHEKESLETIVARDMSHDCSWMNLQMETESVALDLEDVIFNELVQEVLYS